MPRSSYEGQASKRHSPIRILLVDDHVLFRKAIASLLNGERDFEVVGEAANGHEAAKKATELLPDIILMDIFMPEMDGLEATRRIKAAIPDARIVILTVSDEDESLFEAVKSVARGYLLKKMEPKALFSTLRGVVQGEASVPRAMAAKILDEFARQARRQPVVALPGAALSPKEKKVLELIWQGTRNKEIAVALAITENTVKSYVKNILEKLHVENLVQAATFAIREGLIERPIEKPD